MADTFDRIRGRAASVITKFGAPVTFRRPGIPAMETSPGVWSAPVDPVQFLGQGISTAGQPQQLVVPSDLVLKAPVTVLVAAQGLTEAPMVDYAMVWNGTEYRIVAVKAVAPNGTPIYYVVMGDL